MISQACLSEAQYAEILLQCLALETLVLVMDGSGVGRGCCALMIHVIYHGRALPLAWVVRQCPKGHAPEALHIERVERLINRLKQNRRIATRYDKCAENYRAMWLIAATLLWL